MIPKLLVIVSILSLAVAAQGQNQFQVLHGFTGGADGGGLWGSVALDRQGNLYGTTSGDGLYGYGTVFELTPQLNGDWEETVLYNFQNPYNSDAPGIPFGGPTLGNHGEIYGTTQEGGAYGYGTVFGLAPAFGGWSLTVLHSFGNANDYGCCPWGSLILDKAGNLFGTGGGIAFELSREPDGSWKETQLHYFMGHNDGFGPQAGLVTDKAGSLYGTTDGGGGSDLCQFNYGCGTVYQLQAVRAAVYGPWPERVLHAFGDGYGDGIEPGLGRLAIDDKGNLYGTTAGGGSHGYGTVFRLVPTQSGAWKETILYNFVGGAEGFEPSGGVTLDAHGNLYGTTIAGGSPNCGCGVVYKLTKQPGGQVEYTVLHTFIGSDGAQPDANLIFDDQGNLYGTTATGGAGGAGVVFELTP